MFQRWFVSAGDVLFEKRSRCYAVLMDAKQGFLNGARSIVQALNGDEFGQVERDLSLLQHLLWSTRHEEDEEHKRK